MLLEQRLSSIPSDPQDAGCGARLVSLRTLDDSSCVLRVGSDAEIAATISSRLVVAFSNGSKPGTEALLSLAIARSASDDSSMAV